MAYTAKTYQRTWQYEPGENTFNARVGAILSGGLDLKTSMRNSALKDVAATQSFEAAEKQNQSTSFVATHGVDGMNSRAPDTRKPTLNPEGLVWVDEKGGYIAPVEVPGSSHSTGTRSTVTTRPTGGRGGVVLTAAQQKVADLDPVHRSMHMWRRINPGCMESTTRVPNSTFTDHFGSKAEEAEKPDKTHHLQKTDFSTYTEVKLRLMQHIKS